MEAHTTMTFLKPMHLPPFYHCTLNPYILKTFLTKTDFVVPFYQTSQELGYQFENHTVAMPGSLSHFSFKKTSHVPSGKLTWQWKSTFSNRKYIFKRWMFQPAMLVYRSVNSTEFTTLANIEFHTSRESTPSVQLLKYLQ